jgi:hypothetical protein
MYFLQVKKIPITYEEIVPKTEGCCAIGIKFNNEKWNLGAIRPTYKQKMNYQQVGFNTKLTINGTIKS